MKAVGKNLHRRQLTVGQRSMIAAEIANLSHGGYGKTKKGITASEAAASVGVHAETVKIAKKIKKEATPEVVEAVKQGKMSLNAAGKTVKDGFGPRVWC